MPDEATPEQRSALPVVLVSMPFMDAKRPSIQIGLLKAVAGRHGFPARTLHANLDFAELVGLDHYQALCEHRGCLIGDWLFSVEAFGAAAPDPDGRLLDEFAAELSYLGGGPAQLRDRLAELRRRDVPSYLDDLVERIPWGDFRVVAFTCTFQQSVASFALAKRLKRRHPGLVTVFGGANFDGVMGAELVRSVSCIDIAVIGEGEVAFPQVLSALAAGTELDGIAGVARRTAGAVAETPARPPSSTLDDLPVPDYDEFFEHAEELGLLAPGRRRKVWLPIETSRGCWWGAKHHCTFCGLNGTTMGFRAKSPGRVLDELVRQARRYRTFRFEAVDNILDMASFKGLFPTLVETGTDYEFFYEVKANLSRPQLRLLAQAGVSHIQPGLESLSSNVLRLMRKGVTAAANVNLLRWAQYYGIHVSWNILWGFPGESEQDVAAQMAVVPYLRHLRPPDSAARIWMERFSPLHTEGGSLLRQPPRPQRSYRHIYPDDVDLDQIAYFFDYEFADTVPDSAYQSLVDEVDAWSVAWRSGRPPELTYWSAPHFVQIYDGRTPGQRGTYTFEGVLADLYLACGERPITATAVRERLGGTVTVEDVLSGFGEFAERGLMFLDGRLALALALPATSGR